MATKKTLRMLWVLLSLAVLSAPAVSEDVAIFAGRGPVKLHVPPGYVDGTPAPLVILLHGYSSSGFFQEAYMQFEPLSDQRGFLFATPNGLIDPFGLRFWNGTDACCQYFGDADDSGYLRGLIDAIAERYSVDFKRVYFIGHSNGGFMSHRMACDHADTVAAVASLAGATWLDPADCQSSEPVHTLQIHGTADDTVLYGGGCFPGLACYPGAVATAEQWAGHNGCSLEGERELPPLDLVTEVAGRDTLVTSYANDCQAGGSAELWTIFGGFHSPGFTPAFSPAVIDYLFAHPKP